MHLKVLLGTLCHLATFKNRVGFLLSQDMDKLGSGPVELWVRMIINRDIKISRTLSKETPCGEPGKVNLKNKTRRKRKIHLEHSGSRPG